MIPYPFDLIIDKGSTKDIHFYVLEDDNTSPYYFSGTNATLAYTCNMQMRRSYMSEEKLLDLSTDSSTDQYIGDSITFSEDEDGLIEIRISAVTTRALPTGKHFYDIELEDENGVVLKLMKGRVELSGEITR